MSESEYIGIGNDFLHDTFGEEITPMIKGKTITRCVVYSSDDGFNDHFLAFHFDDGMSLRFRYDWIYDWYLFPKSVEYTYKGNL